MRSDDQPTQPLTDAELARIREHLASDNVALHDAWLADDALHLLAEVDRLRTWNGLMELLDEKWPEDIFPTLEDDAARDPGPRIVSLLRWNIRLRRELAALKAERDDLAALDQSGEGQR